LLCHEHQSLVLLCHEHPNFVLLWTEHPSLVSTCLVVPMFVISTLLGSQTTLTDSTYEVPAPVEVAVAVAGSVVVAADVAAVDDIVVGHLWKKTFFRVGTEQGLTFPEILTGYGLTRWFAFV
jgi:hypothetical protein